MAARTLTPEEVAALPPEVRKGLGLAEQVPSTSPELPPEVRAAAEQAAREHAAANARPDVSALETFKLRGAGAVPAGGLVTDLIGSAILQLAKKSGVGAPGAVLTPQAQAQLYQLATKEGVPQDEAEAAIRDPGNPIGGPVDVYRMLRDTRKARTAAGSQEHPEAGMGGAALGTVASILAPLPAFKLGSGVWGRIGSGALTGAGYGALDALTSGDADLTRGQFGEAARETANKALGGAALGGAVAAGTEGVSRLWPLIRRSAIEQGTKVLGGSSDIAAATRKPLKPESVEEVFASGGIRPFDTTAQTHARVAELADEAGTAYGQIVRDLEARGVEGPDARALAEQWLARHAEEFASSGSNKGPANVFRDEAQNLMDVANGQNLGLGQAESIKQALQRDARFHRLNASPSEENLQEVSSRLRQAVEDSVERAGAQSQDPEVQALANAFTPVKQRAARLLNAREFTERAASKASQRGGGPSLMDRIVGAGTSGGSMLQAEANARAMSLARNRLPSALAAGTYALSHALETGEATPAVSKAFAMALSPDITDPVQALIEYLRKDK